MGFPSFALSFVETPFTQWHEILSRIVYKPKISISPGLESVPGRDSWRTDGQTDRITVAKPNTRYSDIALARKKWVATRESRALWSRAIILLWSLFYQHCSSALKLFSTRHSALSALTWPLVRSRVIAGKESSSNCFKLLLKFDHTQKTESLLSNAYRGVD